MKIRQGEGVMLDFKFRIDDQKKIARTLAAFANTQGGTLLIGVKDNGKITGVDPEEEYYMIEGAAANYCRPPVVFTSRVWQEERHLVLEVNVSESESRHKAIKEDGGYTTFYRIEDNTVLGNKILDKVWSLRKHGPVKPGKFSDAEIDFIKLVEMQQPVSLSKLYRMSSMDKNEIDGLLPALIYWEIIGYRLIEDRINYYIRD